MTNTNAAVQTPATDAAKQPTKMEHARVLFKEIYATGYKLPEGKSQRAHFIDRAMGDFGMTKHGAATYFQNLSNEAKGEPTYKYNTKKKKADGTPEGTTKGEADAASNQLNTTTSEANKGLEQDKNMSPAAGAIGQFRWMVTNAEGDELASWPTRAKAQAEAKAIGAEWADRNA